MEKSEFFFCVGGGGGGERGKEHSSGPLAPEARGRHSTSTSLALKVTRIVYNPPPIFLKKSWNRPCGYIGWEKRRPLPACVYHSIRKNTIHDNIGDMLMSRMERCIELL